MANETQNLIKTLTSKGLVGVMIGLILLSGSSMWILYKLVGNHIDHTNDVIDKHSESNVVIAESLSELTTFLKTKLD